jgi:hypothetical protein
MKERGRDHKRAARSPRGIAIDDESRRHLQAPMRNFNGLVASQARGERGLREGCEATYRQGLDGHLLARN